MSDANRRVLVTVLGLSIFLAGNPLPGEDWPRFRGPNGTGICTDAEVTPLKWDTASEGVQWVLDLPGPGHSSPIVVGDRVFLTCWTGYAENGAPNGRLNELERHLICVERQTGQAVWNRVVRAALPENLYTEDFMEHGYASHTPASDGESVFAFFGKSGIHAFRCDGDLLWTQSVGSELDSRRWGSAASPILYEDLVIVSAAQEGEALFALDKHTGAVVWKQTIAKQRGLWGTPTLARVDGDRTDLVLAVNNELWGLNPRTGKLRWHCEGTESDTVTSSPVATEDQIFSLGSRTEGVLALRLGGMGDVNDSHVTWRANHRGRVVTPLIANGRLFWTHSRMVHCVDATTGKLLFKHRLPSETATLSPDGTDRHREGTGQDFASPVAHQDRVYLMGRNGVCVVIANAEAFQLLAVNSLAKDGGDFSATPAISRGQIFIRSTRKLYCIGQEPTSITDTVNSSR